MVCDVSACLFKILLLCTKTEFLPYTIVSHAFLIIEIAQRYMVSESNTQTNSVRFIRDPVYSLLTSNLQIEGLLHKFARKIAEPVEVPLCSWQIGNGKQYS